jgi:RNA polymerase sigma-70 factor (ECF subfamily)
MGVTAQPRQGQETTESRASRFASLHDEHFEPVRRYVWRRSPGLADDVAAETFVVAWRRLDDVPLLARPWLIGVARNIQLNALRSERRQQALALHIAASAPPGPAAGETEEAALSASVADALSQLADKDREVLLLHAWEELDRDGIGQVLGCSKANVSVRLHRARRRFRAALEEAELANEARRTFPSIPGGATDGC